MAKTIKLSQHEDIIAIVPEYCAGPGWSNAVTWVHIVDRATGKHRTEDIQPDERTPEMHHLFRIAASVHDALIAAVPARRKRHAQ